MSNIIWHNVSDELPKECGAYLVTINVTYYYMNQPINRRGVTICRFTPHYTKEWSEGVNINKQPTFDHHGTDIQNGDSVWWIPGTTGDNEDLNCNRDVIAWAELPEPYIKEET